MATALLTVPAAAARVDDKPSSGPVAIQVLAVSDWHAQLDPIGGIGGAATLSSYWKADRAARPNTLTFTAGDAYGGSPPISSYFDEVPAVRAMNLMGFTADTFGNHNFDKGIGHLQSMIDLADFDYVSANLRDVEDNLTGVTPWKLYHVAGVKVAVIGVTNPEAPTLVFPGSFGSIEVTDAADAANKRAAIARKAGASVVIVLIHAGMTGKDAAGTATGPLRDFAERVEGVDLILGDHTDVQFEGKIGDALVVENRSKGQTYSKTQLTVDPAQRTVTSMTNAFVVPTASAVTPDQAIVDMLAPYRAELTPILSGVIGTSNRFIPRSDSCGRSDSRICESLVGNVVTDAMRSQAPGSDFAISNSGGLRAPLTCPVTDDPSDFCPAYTPPPYPITRGQVRATLAFGNILATARVNGAELKAYLEHGVSAMPAVNGRFAQVSGLCFSYDISQPAGSRVLGAVRQAADGSCTGLPVSLLASSTYSIAINDFMASGGDGYPSLLARSATLDPLDAAAIRHIAAASPLNPAIQGRIVCTSSGSVACPAITAP